MNTSEILKHLENLDIKISNIDMSDYPKFVDTIIEEAYFNDEPLSDSQIENISLHTDVMQMVYELAHEKYIENLVTEAEWITERE